MRGLVATALLLTGCDRVFATLQVHDQTDALTTDVAIDVPVDAACTGTVYGGYGSGGSGLFSLCVTETPQATYFLPAAVDTTVTAMCTLVIPQAITGSDSLCVVVAQDIRADTISRVVGTLPLVLVATNTLTVTGTIDVGSIRGAALNGAGANEPSCPGAALKGTSGDATTYGAGGAGGTYQTSGGKGGSGNAGATAAGVPSGPGTALTYLRGGCRGGNGGNSTGTTGGGGGASGGVVYLIAGGTVEITSTGILNASGEGGGGGGKGTNDGEAGGGGGGGGSGGLIGIDAPLIRFGANARLIANGGGGGGSGGVGTSGSNGVPGSSASPSSPFAFAAAGGTADSPGGGGATATMMNGGGGTSGSSTQGGGGGGGGLGYIKLFTQASVQDGGALISPAPS